jgi:F-type H+-transporting ATPase subunit b
MESLGIDLKLILAQIVNFLALFFLLNKFLYKPILKFLDERKKKIEASLINAEKISKQLAAIEEQQKQILEQARLSASRIISEGKKFGQEEKEKIIEEAKKKAGEEMKKGVALARQELEKAQGQLRQEAVNIAAEMAKKVLEKLSDEEKHKLLKTSLDEKS